MMDVKKVAGRVLISLGLLLFFLPITAVRVEAESFFEYYFIPDPGTGTKEEEAAPDEVPREEYGALLENLPEEIKKKLPAEMFSGSVEDIAEGAESLIGFDTVWGSITDSLTDTLQAPLRMLATVFGTLLLSAVAKALQKSLASESLGEAASMAVRAGVCLTLVGRVSGLVTLTETFGETVCSLMNGTVPLLGAVYAVSGNVSTAAVQSGGILMLVTLCQNLFTHILLPSVRICLAMSAIGALFPDIGIRTVSSLFKNITNWIMVAAVTVFSFVLGLQNTIAQSADTFGARSLKFLVGNLIPIIGSPVAESLGTVGGSLSVVKAAGGGVAVAVILVTVLPTLMSLLLHKCALGICGGAAVTLGCEEEGRLLSDINSAVSMLCAFAAAVGVAFIYALTLFMTSSLALSA